MAFVAPLSGMSDCLGKRSSPEAVHVLRVPFCKEVRTEISAEDLIWWAHFRLQDIKKQRERRKIEAEKGRQEKEEETWKHENPHLFGGGFS